MKRKLEGLKTEQVAFRVSKEFRKLMEVTAAAEKFTMAEIFDQGVRLRMAIPPGTYDEISKIAWNMQVPIHTILVHKMLAKVAQEAAWLKVFGSPSPATALQFQFKDGKLLTGNELANELYQDAVIKLEEFKKKVSQLEKGESVTISPVEASTFLEELKPAGA